MAEYKDYMTKDIRFDVAVMLSTKRCQTDDYNTAFMHTAVFTFKANF
jgi:hypothetical protein